MATASTHPAGTVELDQRAPKECPAPGPEPHLRCVRTDHAHPDGSPAGHLWMDPENAALYSIPAPAETVTGEACASCNVPRREHIQQWTSDAGWHGWIAPGPALITARIRRRLQAAGRIPAGRGEDPEC